MGGGTYEETLFGLFGLHGSAVGFLYGLLFPAGKRSLCADSADADCAIGLRQRCRRACRNQNLPSSGGECSGEHHICSVSLDRRLLDVRGVQRKLDPGI